MCPHGDFGRNMNQLEMTGLALPGFTGVCLVESQVEESVIPSGVIILRPCSEFLVSCHQRRSNIMSQENGLSVDMKKLDNILVSNNTSTTGLRECLSGNNLPFIVRIFMTVAGNLLTC